MRHTLLVVPFILVMSFVSEAHAVDASSLPKKVCKPIPSGAAAEWQARRRKEISSAHPNYSARQPLNRGETPRPFDPSEVVWRTSARSVTAKTLVEREYHIPMNHLSPHGDIKPSLREAEVPTIYFFGSKLAGFSQETWAKQTHSDNSIVANIFHPGSMSTVPTVESLIRMTEVAGTPKRHEHGMDVFDYPFPRHGECFPEELMILRRASGSASFLICQAREDYRPFSDCDGIVVDAKSMSELRVRLHSSLIADWGDIADQLTAVIGSWRHEAK